MTGPDQHTATGVPDRSPPDEALLAHLRGGLVQARHDRDHRRMRVIRSLVAAVDDAGAPPATAPDQRGPASSLALGLGSAEATRRVLDESALRDILAVERAEHERAMQLLADAGRVEASAGHAAAIAVVDEFLAWLRSR